MNKVGDYSVTYDVSDSALNVAETVTRTVTVMPTPDTTKPIISLLGDNPQILTVGDIYLELGAMASDNVDGNITANIQIDTSSVDMNVPGDYSVTYDVSDAAGNPAETVTRTVVISDTTNRS